MIPLCIGLICEGPTDVVAIKCLLGETLRRDGVEADFRELQPTPDRTRKNPEAGWGNVEAWLQERTLADRLEEHIFGGIFADDLATDNRCDILLLQIDGDNLDDQPFRTFNQNRYELELSSPSDPSERFDEIATVLSKWGMLDGGTDAERRLHLLAPAIENTETWCLAAFERQDDDIERMRKADQGVLVSAMIARIEGKDVNPAAMRVPKGVEQRITICKKLLKGNCPTRLLAQSSSFRRLHDSCVASARDAPTE